MGFPGVVCFCLHCQLESVMLSPEADLGGGGCLEGACPHFQSMKPLSWGASHPPRPPYPTPPPLYSLPRVIYLFEVTAIKPVSL